MKVSHLTLPAPVQPTVLAAQTVETVRAQYLTQRQILQRYGLVRWTGDTARPVADPEVLRSAPGELFHMQNTALALSRWYAYRQAYAPHPDLTDSLLRAKADTTLPGAVLRRLPHPNPLLVFSGGLPLVHTDRAPGRLLACLVTGSHAHQYPSAFWSRIADTPALPPRGQVLADTTDEDINAFHLTAISEVHNPQGTHVVDIDWCRVSLPLVEEFTPNSLIEEIIDGGFRADPLVHARRPPELRNYLRTIVGYVLPHLLYLVSDKMEIERSASDRPPAKAGKERSGQTPKPVRIHYCGQRLGAAMRAWRERGAGARPARTPSGRTVAPHWRGSHFHTYRVGPGRPNERTEKIIKFVLPFPINADLDDGHTIAVRPVY